MSHNGPDRGMMRIDAFRHIRECPCNVPDCISRCICYDETAKWLAKVDGFPDFIVVATSRDKAKMAIFRSMKDAGYARDFKEFAKSLKSLRRTEWVQP
jgi:hypothetical protein